MIFPIIVFIFDCDIRRVYRRRELHLAFVFKVIAWTFYYLIVGLAGRNNDPGVPGLASHSDLLKLINFIFLIWPIVAVIYSICLTKFPLISASIGNLPNGGLDNDEQIRRFENMLNERASLIDQR